MGAAALLASFWVYEAWLETQLYEGFVPAANTLQWVLLGALILLLACGLLSATRLPWRTHLAKAVALQALGAGALLLLWVLWLTLMMRDCVEC